MAADMTRDERALQLMRSATALAREGEWEQASAELEEAAKLHREAGRSYDEARCLQMSASLRRAAGDPAKARELAEQAAAVVVTDQPLAVSIAAEQGETAFAEGRWVEAAAAYTRAIERGREAGLRPDGLSALLRRRAAAYVASGLLERAAADYDEAYRLVEAEHDPDVAGFVRIEQARTLFDHGYKDEAERVIATLDPLNASEHLLAEIFLMRARLARASGLIEQAVSYSSRARIAALAAVAPLSYFGASAELAEALQARGDWTGAYAVLATTWVTLADLLGKDVAQSWVEPVLAAYKQFWGEAAFNGAKAEYEERRRAEMGEKT